MATPTSLSLASFMPSALYLAPGSTSGASGSDSATQLFGAQRIREYDTQRRWRCCISLSGALVFVADQHLLLTQVLVRLLFSVVPFVAL
ncbi:hypothetical protein B0H13DRAFT_2064336, partial [Mycena leptocephala]